MNSTHGTGSSSNGTRHAGAGSQRYLAGTETSLGFPPERTALLVIDPVNDFLSEGGAAWDMTKHTVQVHDVIGHLRRAIDGARSRGIPVLYGPMAYTEEDYADGKLQCRCGINRLMFEQKMFLAGSWGADFHPDLRPGNDEIVLKPHKGTDVFETDLPEHLERLGISHLVIAGMTANLCCESTGRHAVEKGYDVTFLSNAIGAENILAYEASIRVNYPLIANSVMEVDEFLAAVDAALDGRSAVRAGDKIRGSDGGKVGTVDEVVDAAGDTDAHLVVSTGLFGTRRYVPLETVIRRAGDEVFINLPKLVVGKMPWDRPPTRQQQQEKRGPQAASVERLYGSRSPTADDGTASSA